jgi:hypothetical protein
MNSFGRIKNGYAPGLAATKLSLRQLRLLLQHENNMSLGKRLKIRSEIQQLTDFITCYQLTEELIRQFRNISSGIFFEIDSIKDRRGRPTDVYVKVVTKERSRVPLKAASFLSHAPHDKDACISEYGLYSVVADIGIADNSLTLLGHELGHIRYIIPNLASYTKFYNSEYRNVVIGLQYVGHSRHDPSGKYADAFEKRLLEDYATYLLDGGQKTESFVKIYLRVRRSMKNWDAMDPYSPIVSNYKFLAADTVRWNE